MTEVIAEGFQAPTPADVAEINSDVQSTKPEFITAEGEAPVKEKTPKKKDTPEPRTYKIKVNKEEMEVSEEELIRDAQQFRAANISVAEARKFQAQAKQQYDQLNAAIQNLGQAIKANDLNTVSKMIGNAGGNFDQLAVQRAIELLEFDNLSDADKRRIQAERKAQEYERQLKQQQQREEQQRQQHVQKVVNDLIQKAVPDALQSVGLAASQYNSKKLGELWTDAVQSGEFTQPKSEQDFYVQARIIAQHVKELREEEASTNLQDLSAEELIAKLGNKKGDIAKLLTKTPKIVPKAESGQKAKPSSSKTAYKTYSQVLKERSGKR